MRVLVCGDRNWTKSALIGREISSLAHPSTIIHGTCCGADTIAGDMAKEMGFSVEEFPAHWERHGRAAGPIRNKQMIDEGKPDVVWAFHEDWANSKGTKNMVNQAKRAGIPVYLFP